MARLGLGLAIRGNLKREFDRRAQRTGDGVIRAMNKTAAELKEDKRRAAGRAGLRGGLVKAIRAQTFENQRINAAAMVFVKGLKGQQIFDLMLKGGTVRAKRGRFLAIPQLGVGRTARARRKKKPSDFIGKKGVVLLPAKRGQFVLVRQTKTRSILLFRYVPITRHRKRVNFEPARRRANRNLAENVVRELHL